MAERLLFVAISGIKLAVAVHIGDTEVLVTSRRMGFHTFRHLGIVTLVLFVSALGLTHAETAPKVEPNTSDGRAIWQLNPNRIHYWTGNDPLLNNLALADGTFLEELAEAGAYDPATQTFLKIPAGKKRIDLGQIRQPSKVNGAHYRGVWVIEWEGDGDISTRARTRPRSKRISANRIEEYVEKDIENKSILSITRIGREGVRNIRAYRKEHEALIKKGEIWSPTFVDLISQYKVLRPLDWPSNARSFNPTDPTRETSPFWGGRSGVPLQSQLKLAVRTGNAYWLNSGSRIGASEGFNDELRAIGKREHQKQRVAMIGAQFDAIHASDEWERFAKHVVAEIDEAGYPLNRMFYLELGNEIWNWAGGLRGFGWGTEWYWGLGQELKRRGLVERDANAIRAGYGYFSALLAEKFAEALAAAGRSDQQWAMVLATQTAVVHRTESALQGVKAYKNTSAFRQPMSRYGVATTGYYKGGFGWRGGKELFGAKLKRDAWRAEWRKRFQEDKQALGNLIRDTLLADTPMGQNVEWIVAKTRGHASMAERYGAFYLGQYEGSSHDVLDKELSKNPAIVEFHNQWLKSESHAMVIRRHAERMAEEFPGAILSNYLHVGAGGPIPKKPWVEAQIWDTTPSPAEAAMLEQLKPAAQAP